MKRKRGEWCLRGVWGAGRECGGYAIFSEGDGAGGNLKIGDLVVANVAGVKIADAGIVGRDMGVATDENFGGRVFSG